jgi:starch phosphorylase
MEIALEDEIPTFSGGLGVLAGDFLRAAADRGLPVVGVTLLYHRGFFHQGLDADGRQVERPVHWNPADHLERLDARVKVTVADRRVMVGAWRRVLTGVGGDTVPVYFLDTLLPENDPADQTITGQLYTDLPAQRLSQEAVLGLAGPAMLRELGHDQIDTFHMNEGHAALAPVALLADRLGGGLLGASPADIESVRDRCVFTTHTPVPAGHDRFAPEVVDAVLGPELAGQLAELGCLEGGTLNMSVLGMFFSGYVNAVARRHGDVARAMFPQYWIDAITNGVHAATWAAPSTARLLDRHVPGWRRDSTMIRYAGTIGLDEVRAAHAEAKQVLADEVARRRGVALDPAALTIGVARRAAAYKRNDLLLSRPDALRALVARVGPLQVLYSGKAHPSDDAGKAVIAHVNAVAKELAGEVTVVYLEDYGMSLAGLLVAGVDVWLNTPMAPYEASGTSGMKAALNGVPSLSVLDGWWLEGWVEGATGWAVGGDRGAGADRPVGDPTVDAADAAELHRVLADVVAPLYYEDPDGFAAVRRHAISLNGSFFNAQRMVDEYAARAYRRAEGADG